MNFFELFEIPVTYFVDKSALRKKFYALSRAFHPDKNIDSTESEKEALLEKTAQINQGLTVLSDDLLRLNHILSLYGFEDKETPSSQFLTEVMDINEALMELELDHNKQKLKEIKALAQSKKANMIEKIEALFKTFETATNRKEILNLIHQKSSEYKYLLRIDERINKFEE